MQFCETHKIAGLMVKKVRTQGGKNNTELQRLMEY